MKPVQNYVVVKRHRITLTAAWVLTMLATAIVYWPALQGPFVFDDLRELSALGNYGGVRDWHSFKAFVFGGTSGPTGRPLALLSFLIDANNWPAEAWSFKRTNLIIHLVNGLLLGILTRQILVLAGVRSERAQWLALFSAATWMVHPFLVSTTMYVVQRMTQLAMLCTIAGMVTYLHGRCLLHSNATKAYAVMTVSLIGFTILGVLSKEIAALLPMLVLVLELTILSGHGQTLKRVDSRWLGLFLVLPSALVVAYLAQSFLRADIFEMATVREFSLYERVLTQPRVVATYLQHWFMPKLYTVGVFQDHFVKSTGLIMPVTTLVTALLHFGAVAFAVVKRRQLPLLAFAILFFYSYHLLESTVLNLELYFEHRNYLPTAFLLLPIIVFVDARVGGRKALFAGVVVLAVLGGFTRYSATVWSDYNSMIEVSAYRAPTSARAQALYARNLFEKGRYDASVLVIDRAAETIQHSAPLLQISRAVIRCSLGRWTEQDMDELIRRLAPLRYDGRYLQLYEGLVGALAGEQCVDSGLPDMYRLFSTMLENDQSLKSGSLPLSQVHYLAGLTALRLTRPEDAMAHFLASISAKPDPSPTMRMAELMANSNFFAEALELSGIALRQIQEGAAELRGSENVNEEIVQEFRKAVRAAMGVAD